MASSQSSGFGATTKWSQPVSFQRKGQSATKPALSTAEFLKQSCDQMKIGVGPRSHADCPHRVTAECYSPDDAAALDEVIAASYRQVFGNAHVMDFERCTELEAQLRNGDLDVRNFVRGLAKSSFYKSRFFSQVLPPNAASNSTSSTCLVALPTRKPKSPAKFRCWLSTATTP